MVSFKSDSREMREPLQSNEQIGLQREGVQQGVACPFAVRVTGGLGDLIVTARFFRDFLASCGGGAFDVFYNSASLAELVFQCIPGFRSAISDANYWEAPGRYPYCFCLNQLFFVESVPPLESGYPDVPHNHSAIMKSLDAVAKRLEPIRSFADNHPRLDGALGDYACFKGRSRRDFLHYLAGIPYGGDLFQIDCDTGALEKFGLAAGQYITLHNGYDDAMGGKKKRTTKVYADWDRVIARLRSLGLTLPIIQIGSPTTSEPIASADRNLIGQTKLEEAMTLVAGSAFHLDNEGGFVHVASAFGRQCCVVFGPTSVEYFGYPGNVNIKPRECGGCWWIEPTWMIDCPRGLDSPVCMDTHDPDAIAAQIMEALAQAPVVAQPRLAASAPSALLHRNQDRQMAANDLLSTFYQRFGEADAPYRPFIEGLEQSFPAPCALLYAGAALRSELTQRGWNCAGLAEYGDGSGAFALEGQGLADLKAQPPASLALIFLALSAPPTAIALVELGKEAQRALQPGGLLIVEAMNADKRATAPDSLLFLAEFCGFAHRRILYRRERPDAVLDVSLAKALQACVEPAPAYALVALKPGDSASLIGLFDAASREIAGGQIEAVRLFEGRIARIESRVHFDPLEAAHRAVKAERRFAEAEHRLAQAEDRLIEAEHRLNFSDHRIVEAEYRLNFAEHRLGDAEWRLEKLKRYNSVLKPITGPLVMFAGLIGRCLAPFRGRKAELPMLAPTSPEFPSPESSTPESPPPQSSPASSPSPSPSPLPPSAPLSPEIEDSWPQRVEGASAAPFKSRPNIAPGAFLAGCDDGATSLMRLLILKLDHIGDMVMALPAMELLRKAWPEGHITLVCAPENVQLARESGLFDEVIGLRVFPPYSGDLDTSKPFPFASIADVVTGVYDIAIDLRHDLDTRPYLAHVNARYRAGYAGPDEHFCLLDLALPNVEDPTTNGEPMHNVHRLCLLAAMVAQRFAPSAQASAKALAAAGALPPPFKPKTYVVLSTGAGTTIKRWSLHKLVELIGRIVEELDLNVVLVGGERERPLAKTLVEAAPEGRVADLIGRLPLVELPALIASACGYVGNDTGVTHMAALLDTATICIFGGANDSRVWRPVGPNVTLLSHPIFCAPCHLVHLADCLQGHACMENVAVEDVLAPLRAFARPVEALAVT